MTREVIFHELFSRDVEHFASMLDAARPGLGNEFIAAVEAQLALIVARPESYRLVSGRTRRALIRRFRALVLFRSTSSHLFVAGVVHGARDTETWLASRMGS